MNRRRLVRALNIVSLSFALYCNASYASDEIGDQQLIYKQNLEWIGAFRLPQGGKGQNTFSYGGRAIAYNPNRNSLYVVGHKHHQLVAEVSIPEPVKSHELSELAIAEIVQPFFDPTQGKLKQINPSDRNSQYIGGQLIYDGRLLVNAYSSYDAAGTQNASLFVRSDKLRDDSSLRGPYLVGSDAHITSAYMAQIPEAWRDKLGGPVLVGNCCRSIIGQHSQGPSVSSFDPETPTKSTKIKARTLLSYPGNRPLGPGASTKNKLFNLTTRVEGILFPENTRSILFFGKHGIGEYCYGEAKKCNDPAQVYKGTHAYPYVYQVWAYDAEDLVKKGFFGSVRDILPYAVWNFNLPFEKDGTHEIGGVAYDSGTGRIFLAQVDADRNRSAVIHAFRVVLPPGQSNERSISER